MNFDGFEYWFSKTAVGRYVADLEKVFFNRFVVASGMQRIVQTGMGAWLPPAGGVLCNGRDFYMQAGIWAWADESVDMLLMPHTLECSGMPHIALAEAYRVLKPEGRVVLTGFNPYSLWGYSKWFDGRLLPERQYCLPLQALKENAAALGFETAFGQFMVYAPPVESSRALRFWRFMEAAGDRWWPHAAAVYGLVLHKHIAGMHVLPEYEQTLPEERGVVLGMAKYGGNQGE